jgi:membrane complex biogenesis BtpA family protein
LQPREGQKGPLVVVASAALSPFGTKPLVAVVHLPPSPGCLGWRGLQVALAELRADLACLDGFDGVLLENDNDKPHRLTVSAPQVAWLTRLALAAREHCAVPLGIGVQRIDWEASLGIAAACGLDFVRLDVFVDRVRMQGEVVEVEPARVVALRQALAAERVELWTDVHVKHAELEPGSASLAESARRAVAAGSDAVLVTGARTGEPPSLDDLAAGRAGRPVIVGSGLTPALAATLSAHADGAVVGTALKEGARIARARAAEMVEAWARASRR